jgi:hypothetical protein
LSTRSAASIAAGVVLLSALIAPAAVLAASPSEGSATVDGATGDWSLGADFFADMTPGGSGSAVLAKLYLRYDCEDEVLYALVLAEDGEKILQKDPTSSGDDFSESYLQIDGSGKAVHGGSGNDGTPPDFAFVNPASDVADGFEASASLEPGSHTLRAHALIADDSEEEGYVAVDTAGRQVSLDIECEAVQPTEVPNPTEQPNPTDTPNQPNPTDTPNQPPQGGVQPTTGTRPTRTLPPTDTLDASAAPGIAGAGVILLVLGVGSLATLVVTLGHRRRPVRAEVKEKIER